MFPDADIETRMHDYTKSIFPHSARGTRRSMIGASFKYRPLSALFQFLPSSGTTARLTDVSFHPSIIISARSTSRLGRPPLVQFTPINTSSFRRRHYPGSPITPFVLVALDIDLSFFLFFQFISRTSRAIYCGRSQTRCGR